jgi:hypothetical protein
MTERGQYWVRWLGKWERSDLAQAEFCRRHGLKAVNFAWWKRKLGKPTEPLRAMGRGPILGRSRPRRPRGRLPAESVELALPVSSSASSRCSSGYELVLPRGVVIRLPVDFDSDRVAQLISMAAWAC